MFKGLGGLGDMGKMMKAAQETQEKMARMQEDLALIEVVGESGAGLVKATATAKGELTGLEIDPSIFNGDDKEINIRTKHPEFLEWKWMDLDKITELVVKFKLHVYEKIQEEVKKILVN